MSTIAQISRIYPATTGTLVVPVYPGKRMWTLMSFTIWGRTTDYNGDMIPVPTEFKTYLMFGYTAGGATKTVYRECTVKGVIDANPIGNIPQIAAVTICLVDRIDFPGGITDCYLFLPSWAHTTGSAWQSTTVGEYI